MYGYFKWQTKKIIHEMIWTWLQRGKPKKETESPLIAV